MARSKQTIPHVTSGFECDAAALVELRERLDERFEQRITYTAIVVKALVPALQSYPLVNASIDDETDEVVEHRYYNVGVAVHTDDGLLVPVVRDADRKSLVEVAAEIERLAEGARERSLAPEELRGGTFTVTNTGSHSEHATFGTPIVNHPEAAILGMGRIAEKPVAEDGELVVRTRLGLTLSYDHRLVDGVTAIEFVEMVIEALEDPDVLLGRL